MNKLVFTCLIGALSCTALGVFAHTQAHGADTQKGVNAVRIYNVNSPANNLTDTNKESALSIQFARGNRMPQYLIMLDESIRQEGEYVSARFLINLQTRLAFVDGKLYNDSLLVYQLGGKEEQIDIKTTAENGEGSYCPALFSFRLTDTHEEQNFLIESWAKSIGNAEGEWVKMNNGVPVAVKTTLQEAKAGKADIFNLGEARRKNTKGNPALDEEPGNPASVVADQGAVNIKGANGKKVTIMNSLGQVIATEILSSDYATLSAPAGIVMVSIEGQPTVKAFVK